MIPSLEKQKIDNLLPKYFSMLRGKEVPRFRLHKEGLREKELAATGHLTSCFLCERRCGANRHRGNSGACGCAGHLSISGNYTITDKDEDLSFLIPGFAIFFLGCPLRCVFCQNPENSTCSATRDTITISKLSDKIERARCKNIHLVGGDPIPHIPFILNMLSNIKRNIPVVWDSCFWMTEEAMELLHGVVDLWVPDFKFGNNRCAKNLSGVSKYTNIIERNLIAAHKDSEMVIRHLIMPNHFDCCTRRVIDAVSANFGDSVLLQLLGGYTPEHKVLVYPNKYLDINREIKKSELKKAFRYADKKGLICVEDC